ncbi:ParB N-terminal domain-containing protein [Streptomyces rimosus]|uniref:ParB N-terminal domain-containing protein n=1 Tax=Streptomyces rimosus TaxID=1927 RepID=UPI0031D9D80D
MIHETIRSLAVPIEDLTPYERNPRRGKVEVVRRSLEVHGQYRPIVVNRPGGVILAGNHTYAAARELGWAEIAVTFVDVDEETAKKILIVDNRASDLATNDPDVLTELLGELSDLEGTGYSEDDVQHLLGGTVPAAEEFASRFEVVVECGSEDAQQEVFERLTGEGWSCRVLSL